METIVLISGLAGIIQLVVFIVLIVKFFQLTNDLREVKLFLFRSLKNSHKTLNHDLALENFEAIEEIPPFSIEGDNVIFSDGKKGKIRKYPIKCSFYDDMRKEIIYNNRQAAISALYIYLTTSKISDKDKYDPTKYNK